MSSQKLMSSKGEEIRRFTDFHGDGGAAGDSSVGHRSGQASGLRFGRAGCSRKGLRSRSGCCSHARAICAWGFAREEDQLLGEPVVRTKGLGTSVDEAREEAGALDASGQASQANGPGPRHCGWGNPGAREELMAPTILVTW
ncbi:unnamed protein product [Ilex paraguariensis]|uniref:Uncharacterized protein n=1 Tax=Ilex paraguariensis TaxID=185542 RepID=A0ABC8RZP7_9AQUA